jgi:hypothetical protein|tara:strand:+ start:638 stop:1822 length:1185 start_codon:yes stop_codon:yes gene_type:complete
MFTQRKLFNLAKKILTSHMNQLDWEKPNPSSVLWIENKEISKVSDEILRSDSDVPVNDLIANVPVSLPLSKESVEKIKAAVSAVRFKPDECDFEAYFDIGRTLLKYGDHLTFNKVYYMERDLWRSHYESGTNPLEAITKFPSAKVSFERENIDTVMDFYLENRDASFRDKHNLKEFIERFVPDVYMSKSHTELHDKSTRRSVAGQLFRVSQEFLYGGTVNGLERLLIEKGYPKPFVGKAAPLDNAFLDLLVNAGFSPNEKVTAFDFREMTEAMMGGTSEPLDGKSINIKGITVEISEGSVIQAKAGMPLIVHGLSIGGKINEDIVLVHDIRSDNVSDIPISDIHKLTGLKHSRSLSGSIENALNSLFDNAPSRNQTNSVDKLEDQHANYTLKRK